MKPDRRTLIITAAIVAGAAILSARQGQRPAGPSGSCYPMPINLNDWLSNAWVAIESTNAKAAELSGVWLTNRNP